MKFSQEHIYQLLLEKQLGEISKDDDKYLQQVMQYDEHVRNCWMELEHAKIATNNDFLDDLREDLAWCKIEALIRPAPSFPVRVVQFLKKHRAAAAVIACFLTTSGVAAWYFGGYRAHAPTGTMAAAPDLPMAGTASAVAPLPGTGEHKQASLAMNGGTLTDSAQQTPIRIGPDTTQPKLAATEDVPIAVEWNTLTVPPKTDYRLELADGTEVHLNASSTLRFPFIFPGKTREVYLEGEAYFIVAKNAKQPFIVHTPNTSVRALGTAFNINSYDSSMIVTSLVQGAAVTDVGDTLDVTLKPGYEAIYRTGERFKVKRFDESITLSWREGMYRFRNKELQELAPVIQRWFGLKLAFDRQSMAALPYTGCLEKDKPVTDFLDQLCNTLKLEYHIYDNTVHFNAKK
ncbi:DUF4974 domain-containing protein [Chitinophaga agrisoli]|uniref:DUF4974 domain-containing protein n=1 Tax=Chitinophaga agrisoli TaxID=2607653 RepID=A0A5B2W551_9BACT|nr:FecR domain-containing protein [Chitinophaga agrisoli]KAA2245772.1 DUF4974 domain-containing protein [Chitinophaga agrisoli]